MRKKSVLNMFFFGLTCLLIASCDHFDDSSIAVIVDKGTKLTVSFESVLNNSNDITLGKFYLLQNGDSIAVERLDYYISTFKTYTSDSSSPLINTISFYSKFNSKNTFSYDYSKFNKEILRLSFISGLTAEQNNTDPSTISDIDHPLNSNKQMYWTKWTKYRFVVFEGRIKTATGAIIPFSFHTGLIYGSNTSLDRAMTLKSGVENPVTIVLNIEKIFIPNNSALTIDYNNGETQAHSDPNDEALSSKFATNFGHAFTIK